ncbi:MAG TPA: Imm5 family immunity protein [Candidatus Dormibacteraeota bacterium]|nr:Imm5 family immunity protein [Candidatus Dormibacteraeota bacterium]
MNDFDVAAAASEFRGEITPAGELPLASRRRLIDNLDAHLAGELGRRSFHVSLGLNCAKRSWPVWQSRFPAEPKPMQMAESAVSGLLTDARGDTVTIRELGRLKTELDNKFLLGERFFTAVYGGFAAWAVVRDVLDTGHALVDDAASEFQTDAESWAPCFFASLAISGGATWEDSGDSARRRRFWVWYLQSAIPDTFAQASRLDRFT